MRCRVVLCLINDRKFSYFTLYSCFSLYLIYNNEAPMYFSMDFRFSINLQFLGNWIYERKRKVVLVFTTVGVRSAALMQLLSGAKKFGSTVLK